MQDLNIMVDGPLLTFPINEIPCKKFESFFLVESVLITLAIN